VVLNEGDSEKGKETSSGVVFVFWDEPQIPGSLVVLGLEPQEGGDLGGDFFRVRGAGLPGEGYQ